MRKKRNIFNLKKNNSGLSTVVSSLILILLALVAIGAIWVVVNNIISSGSKQVNLNQFTFDIAIKSAYVSGSNILVTVRRSAGGGTLGGMKFVFINNTQSVSVDENVSINELDTRTFTFTSSQIPGISAGDTVSVAPIYIVSGQNTVGNPTDTATISGTPPAGGTGGNTGGGAVCGNGICEVSLGETPGNCPVDCTIPSSCNGTWTPGSEDSGVVCDGGYKCQINCQCPQGYTADGSGGCNLNPPINTGIISLVWPQTRSANRFQSDSLPKNQDNLSGYTTYSVNFTGSNEQNCFGISSAFYYPDINMSEVGLYIPSGNTLANISSSERYNIWGAPNCGQ